MKLTKKAIHQLQVEERRKMRAKQANSAFLRKTLSIYNGQHKRAVEMKHFDLVDGKLPFTLEQFREFFAAGLEQPCPYSGQKLALKCATADHDMPLARGGALGLHNQVVCHQSANWQKGMLSRAEHTQIMGLAQFLLDKDTLADFRARLTTGGKWKGRG